MLVIRIAAITLASDSAITIARFCASKIWVTSRSNLPRTQSPIHSLPSQEQERCPFFVRCCCSSRRADATGDRNWSRRRTRRRIKWLSPEAYKSLVVTAKEGHHSKDGQDLSQRPLGQEPQSSAVALYLPPGSFSLWFLLCSHFFAIIATWILLMLLPEGYHHSTVRKRSFGSWVLGGTYYYLAFPISFRLDSRTEKEHPKELSHHAAFFWNAFPSAPFSEDCDNRSLLRGGQTCNN